MPNLPPLFNGKISGVLILSVLDISWYNNVAKSTYVQFEWTGSQEKHKLLTSKYSKLTYDIRTSYRSFLNYISTCTLKCSIINRENKIFAHASMKNLLIVAENNQLVKILPLMNNEELVGNIKLSFNIQTFNDTSFDNDIKSLKQFGIQNEVLNNLYDKQLYNTEVCKTKLNLRPISSSSFRTNRSKEELTNDYLMGKDMAPEEEEEALSTLRIMPSAESIVTAAEKISAHSPTPLHIQGHTKKKTSMKPSIKTHEHLEKPCTELKCDLKKSLFKKFHKATVPKKDVYLHLSIFSVTTYRTIKSLQNYLNSTFIVQCIKDQEPCKLLRFMSKQVDDNVVKFKKATLSSHLEGCTAKGITIKAYVRLLSERSPIVLGETKQMLDWPGFSTTFDEPRYIRVSIWNNDGRITGHLSLSYTFSKTPTIQHENHIENALEIEVPQKLQSESNNNFESIPKIIRKNEDLIDTTPYHKEDQIYLHNQLYPENNKDIIRNQLLLNDWPKRNTSKEKAIQTNIEVRQFNKSVQTQMKNVNVAVQVDSDELEDLLDKTVCFDVQNIFRCTHEFTLNIEKKYNSTFNYVTYQFPECVTNTTGKVITCCRIFRTFGNTNILHLVTLPTTIPLETYFYKNYKKASIVLNLHQSHDYLSGKVSLLLSHLIDMANEFKNSHIAKNLILNSSLSIHELSHNNVRIKIYYNRVYHSFPSPEKQFKNSNSSHKSLKKKSIVTVDLTESDDDEGSINKTYTLFKHNCELLTSEISTQTESTPVKISHNCKTQTEKDIKEQCIIINDKANTIDEITERESQRDQIIVAENQANTNTSTKIRQKDTSFRQLNNGDIFNAKVTIVAGYNLPLVKLNGETIPSAPTTYIIMEVYGTSLSTSSIVQQRNPVWNSEWIVVLPKNKLIKGKWLILGLWCKKYKNEFAGHDPKRDIRLGYIFINLYTLCDSIQADNLYDVISETEEYQGKIKVIIDSINWINPNINRIVHINKNNINQEQNDNLINKMPGGIQMENNSHVETKKSNQFDSDEKFIYCVDLTVDTPQKLNKTPLKNDNNISEIETTSSVTSWTTSSSDDILRSTNSQIVNYILGSETKMNRIRRIIQD